MNHPHYDAAIRADEHFQAQCVRVFGARAADMRYQPMRWPSGDQALWDAAQVKHDADARWLNTMRGAA